MRQPKPTRMPGGAFFGMTKADTVDVPTQRLSAREPLRIPLWVPDLANNPPTQTTPEVLVKAGAKVSAGELLAGPASDGPPWARVFAPVAGVVGERTAANSVLGFPLPALELTPDGDSVAAAATTNGDVERLAALGLGLPDAEPLDWLIVDGLESDPYATARTRTLVEHSTEIIEAAGRLADILGVKEVRLAVDGALSELLGTVRELSRDSRVSVVALSNKYPQSHPWLLFRAVTGHPLSPGVSPRDYRGAVVGTCAMMDVHRALNHGTAPTEQTITIAGDAVQRPGNYRVPLGSSVEAVLRRVGLRRAPARIVAGSAITGVALTTADAVIVRGIEGLYAWSALAIPDRDPVGCVRCGFCVEICPVRIDPVGVYHTVELGRARYVPPLVPRLCIDCGLCSYVCPAALSLMDAMRTARTAVAEEVAQ